DANPTCLEPRFRADFPGLLLRRNASLSVEPANPWAGVLEGYGYAQARDAKSSPAHLISLVSAPAERIPPLRHSRVFVTRASGPGVASWLEEVRANVEAPPRAAP